MLEGHYCLKNRAEDIEELKNTEKRNYSIEITKAVRDTKVENLVITKDNYIGLVNGKIKYTATTLKELVEKMLDELLTINTITVVVSEGKDKDEEAKNLITGKLNKIKTTYINGGQENYNYYIYIENRDPNMPEIAILTDSVSDLSDEDIIGLPIKNCST